MVGCFLFGISNIFFEKGRAKGMKILSSIKGAISLASSATANTTAKPITSKASTVDAFEGAKLSAVSSQPQKSPASVKVGGGGSSCKKGQTKQTTQDDALTQICKAINNAVKPVVNFVKSTVNVMKNADNISQKTTGQPFLKTIGDVITGTFQPKQANLQSLARKDLDGFIGSLEAFDKAGTRLGWTNKGPFTSFLKAKDSFLNVEKSFYPAQKSFSSLAQWQKNPTAILKNPNQFESDIDQFEFDLNQLEKNLNQFESDWNRFSKDLQKLGVKNDLSIQGKAAKVLQSFRETKGRLLETKESTRALSQWAKTPPKTQAELIQFQKDMQQANENLNGLNKEINQLNTNLNQLGLNGW